MAMDAATTDGLFVRPDADAFAAIAQISVDYAVMERSDQVLVVPASFAWSDVGSWDAVRELLRPRTSRAMCSKETCSRSMSQLAHPERSGYNDCRDRS